MQLRVNGFGQLVQGERFGEKALIVSPGVRPAGQNSHEHQRSLTPFDAIQAGADYLVVGRPIRDAASRRNAAQEIQDEIALALKAGPSKQKSMAVEE